MYSFILINEESDIDHTTFRQFIAFNLIFTMIKIAKQIYLYPECEL